MPEVQPSAGGDVVRAARTRRFGIAAIIVVGIGCSMVMQTPGWAQTSYYALIRALSHGTPQIDRYHWETKDKSWIDGHFYSVKAPGLPVALLPAYEVFRAVGLDELSVKVGKRVREQRVYQWYPREKTTENFGFSQARATQVRTTVSDEATMIWALGLLGTVLPAVALMLLARSLTERFRPGTGAASALALGLGTMVLPFATQLLGHLLATLCLFGSFVLLIRERSGPERLGLVALAGLLSGLAVFVEYPLAFGGAVVGLYAMLRGDAMAAGARSAISRAVAYGGGALLGALPVGIYNLWAFGSPTKMSYSGAVAVQGRTGHDRIGLNDSGFFGIGIPKPANLVELLFAPRGLIAATPVVAACIVGVILMHRGPRKAEARTILGVAAIYLVYAAGYWLPFGGGTPGPRFLIPVLPFLALGLPWAWRRIPSTTLALGTVSATVMVIATVTFPLVGQDGLGRWWARLSQGKFLQTVFTALGAGNGWTSTGPVIACFLVAVVLAAFATFGVSFRRDLWIAGASLLAWLLLALKLAPRLHEHKAHELMRVVGIPRPIVLMAALLALAAVALATVATWKSRSGGGSDREDHDVSATLAADT